MDCKYFGISQNPSTNDYIIVQNIFIWASGTEKIDDFIQEMQLKFDYQSFLFEWIPYDQFNDIIEMDKGGSTIVYSAIWKKGPLYYDYNKWRRNSNKKVALKNFYNSQNITNEFLNDVKYFLNFL